jgi:hypothetical protein
MSKPKQWWSSIKSILGRSKGSSIPALLKDGTMISDDKEKAELFNATYLASSKLNDTRITLPDLPNPSHELLNEITIKESEVNEILPSRMDLMGSAPAC